MRIPAAVMSCVLIYNGVAAAQGYKGSTMVFRKSLFREIH